MNHVLWMFAHYNIHVFSLSFCILVYSYDYIILDPLAFLIDFTII